MRSSRFSPHRTRDPPNRQGQHPGPRLALRPSQQIPLPRFSAPVRRDDQRGRKPLSPNRRAQTSAATTRRPRPATAPPDGTSAQGTPQPPRARHSPHSGMRSLAGSQRDRHRFRRGPPPPATRKRPRRSQVHCPGSMSTKTVVSETSLFRVLVLGRKVILTCSTANQHSKPKD